jgi:hypothetical protein
VASRGFEAIVNGATNILLSAAGSRSIDVGRVGSTILTLIPNASRIIEVIRAAAQAISFTISGLGEFVAGAVNYLANGSVNIALTATGSRLADVGRAGTQAITIATSAAAWLYQVLSVFGSTAIHLSHAPTIVEIIAGSGAGGFNWTFVIVLFCVGILITIMRRH